MMGQVVMQDVKALGKVAVLMGGFSGERDVSLMSGKAVLDALLSVGVDAHPFDPKEIKLVELKMQGFTRCFNALHGMYGEDGGVQAELERLEIPYTGSGVKASAVGMDKVLTKRVWLEHGLSTPAFEVVDASKLDQDAVDRVLKVVGLPLIVKPATEGSSIGIYKVFEADKLYEAISQAGQHDSQVLCEKFIQGDEATCAVIGSADAARALPVVRIIAPEGNYDYEHKYFKDDTKYECPAKFSQEETMQLQNMILQAYKALNCRGWGRIDVMIDAQTRQPYLLEVNTSPGMTTHSLVPMAAREAGISFAQLCVLLLKDATLDAHIEHVSKGFD